MASNDLYFNNRIPAPGTTFGAAGGQTFRSGPTIYAPAPRPAAPPQAAAPNPMMQSDFHGYVSSITSNDGGGGGLSPAYGAGSAAGPNGGLTPAALKNLSTYITGMQDKSRSENQARLDQMMKLAGTYGQSANTRNDELTRNAQQAAQQNLTTRGLGNTTVVNNVQQNVARQGQEQQRAILEQQSRLQMGVLDGVSTPYPDMGLYASLLGQGGASAGLLSQLAAVAGKKK